MMTGKIIFGLLMLLSAGLATAFLIGALRSIWRQDWSGVWASLFAALVLMVGAVYFFRGFQGDFDQMVRRLPWPFS